MGTPGAGLPSGGVVSGATLGSTRLRWRGQPPSPRGAHVRACTEKPSHAGGSGCPRWLC